MTVPGELVNRCTFPGIFSVFWVTGTAKNGNGVAGKRQKGPAGSSIDRMARVAF